MNTLKKFAAVVGIAAVLLLCTNCAALLVGGAAAGGAGAVAYVRGELRSTLDVGLSAACKAVDRAAADLSLSSEQVLQDGLESKRVFRTSTGKRVTVKLRRVTDQTTTIAIRFGTFGDQPMSQQFLTQIQSRL